MASRLSRPTHPSKCRSTTGVTHGWHKDQKELIMALSTRAQRIVDEILSNGRNPSGMKDWELLKLMGCGKGTLKEIREDYPISQELAEQIAASDKEESE